MTYKIIINKHFLYATMSPQQSHEEFSEKQGIKQFIFKQVRKRLEKFLQLKGFLFKIWQKYVNEREKNINFKEERIQKDNLHFINEFKLYTLLHIQSMQGVQQCF